MYKGLIFLVFIVLLIPTLLAAGDSFANAEEIILNKDVSGSVHTDDVLHFYKIDLSKGENVTVTIYMTPVVEAGFFQWDSMTFKMYNKNFDQIKEFTVGKDKNPTKKTYEFTAQEKGMEYIKIYKTPMANYPHTAFSYTMNINSTGHESVLNPGDDDSDSVGDDEKKICNINADCGVSYNVLFNNKCSAGCFNSKVVADTGCDLLWEPLIGKCKCEDNICVLVIGDENPPITKECDGCSYEEKCYPISTRFKDANKNRKYCSLELEISNQKTVGEACDNYFECEGNVCINDECIDAGLLKRMLEWFKRTFSRNRYKH
ncbi:MAG: hypothetical protein ABIE22_03395 [archaeon]